MKTLNQFLEQAQPPDPEQTATDDPKLKQDQKKDNMLKKRVLMTKMRAIRGGATGILASYEPEGEVIGEKAIGAVVKQLARIGAKKAVRVAKDKKVRKAVAKAAKKIGSAGLEGAVSGAEERAREAGHDSTRNIGKKKVDEGVMTMLGRKKKEKKAEKAMDAGSRARRKVARRVHAKYVSGSEDNVPDDIREEKKKGRHPRDQKELDRAEEFIKKNPNFGKVSEAKVDAGKSPEQKEKDRNVRKFGVSHNVAGHGKLRRALHRSDRGDKKIKGDKSAYVEMEAKRNPNRLVEPRDGVDSAKEVNRATRKAAFRPFNKEEKEKGLDGKACWKGYKLAGTKKKGGKTVDNCVKEEDKAFNYVVAKLRKQHGDGVLTKGQKPKPPTAAQKKKNAEIRAKRAKEDHRDPTEKASDGRYSDRYSNRGSD